MMNGEQTYKVHKNPVIVASHLLAIFYPSLMSVSYMNVYCTDISSVFFFFSFSHFDMFSNIKNIQASKVNTVPGADSRSKIRESAKSADHESKVGFLTAA